MSWMKALSARTRCLSPASSRSHSSSRQHPGHDVEGDQPLGAFFLAIDGKGDADPMEQDASASARFCARRSAGWLHVSVERAEFPGLVDVALQDGAQEPAAALKQRLIAGPGFRRAGFPGRLQFDRRIDLGRINAADQRPPLIDSAAHVRLQVRTVAGETGGENDRDPRAYRTAHRGEGAAHEMGHAGVDRRTILGRRRRLADDLHRMAAVEPGHRFGHGQRKLQALAAVSALRAAEMHIHVAYLNPFRA
jgi:hypothetical protein